MRWGEYENRKKEPLQNEKKLSTLGFSFILYNTGKKKK